MTTGWFGDPGFPNGIFACALQDRFVQVVPAPFAAVEEAMLARLLSFVLFRPEMLEPCALKDNPKLVIRERGHA
jgi:hypothetical protein